MVYSVFPGGPTSSAPYADAVQTSDNARCAECGQTMGMMRYWVTHPLTGNSVPVHPGCREGLASRKTEPRFSTDTSNRGQPIEGREVGE